MLQLEGVRTELAGRVVPYRQLLPRLLPEVVEQLRNVLEKRFHSTAIRPCPLNGEFRSFLLVLAVQKNWGRQPSCSRSSHLNGRPGAEAI